MAGNYERVMEERKKLVDQIINNMKEGYLIPKPQWNQNIFRIINPVSGARYRGANMLKLYMSSVVNGYQDNRWMTYKQAESKGYHVKKGETGIRLEKYIFEKQVEQENEITGQKEKVWVKLSKPMINTFVVFNGEQIDGIPELVHQEIKQQDSEVWKIADDLIASSECPVREEPQGNAYYSPQTDSITLPPREVFISPEAFTTTLIHEMCHSTGHETRLNRPILNKFGSPEYALEELRAELGAFFMGADLGIEGSEELLASHTQYLESWITVLKNDPNELFRAMSDSQKAVDRLSANYEKVREKEQTNINTETREQVAIESTIDYSEPEVGFVSVATDNMPAGTKYRLVTLGEKGNLVPYQEADVMYLNREELQDYIEAHKDALEVVNYDDMVYQAGKLKSEYTSKQHEMIESGLHSFEFEDGYLHFSLDVNGYSYDGLYRIYDPANGKSREIVSFNDYDPVIKENWDFIEHRLTQYVNEHPEVGLNGEQIPRERPSIYCEWSEHGAFRDGAVYTPSEFSRIMEESDNEWIRLREMEQQQYGKDAFDILMDQGLPQHQTYAKVKYEIYIPGMEPLTVRQDIGDGFGSVYTFLKRNSYMEYANNLIKNMSDVQIQKRLNYIHTNYVNMLGDIQKFARFEIDDLHGEQSYRDLIERRNLASSLDSMVQTNHGEMPLIDYLDIEASQYGFDSYEELLDEGMSIGQYSHITKGVIREWKNMKTVDVAIDKVMEEMELQIMEPELDLEL